MIKKCLSTILMIFCLNLSVPIAAGAPDSTKSVILTVVNHLSLEDLRQMERLPDGDWMRAGAVGAMNLRVAGKINDENNAVSIASGTRAVGSKRAVEAYMATDEVDGTQVGDWHEQLTGRAVSANAIVVPYYNEIKINNFGSSYAVVPGELGETLRRHRLRAAALGHSDIGDQPVRFGPLLAMDAHGVVAGGDLSSKTTRPAPDRVYGVATDYDYLLASLEKFERTSSLVVVELGDLYRLSSVQRLMDPDRYESMKTTALVEINRFMKTIVSRQKDGQMIMMLAPMVSPEARQQGSMMAPYVQIEPDHVGGALRTATTRQPGIVANVDVAPTILNWLELPIPSRMMGRPIAIERQQAETEFWSEWERIKHVYATRSDVLTSYVSFQIAILIIATAFAYVGKPGRPMYRAANLFLRVLLLLIALSPFLLLILPLFPTVSDARLIVGGLFLLGVVLSAALVRLSFPWIFLIVSCLNWFPILLDGVLWEAALMKRSYLGYDAVIGARYYGIGNEYMGVAIGSSILSVVMLLELTKEKRQWIKAGAVALFVIYLLFFATPKWGSNAGGAITAAVAYSVVFIRLFEIRLPRKALFGLAGVIALGVGLLFWANAIGDDQSQSHIGRAMTRLMQGDFLEIGNIIRRKLEMNWKLIGVSAWSKVFITSILLLGFLCYRPFGMVEKFSRARPYLIRGFLGIVVGAFVALLVNDSGIIAAATTILYMIVPMIFLGLTERMERLDAAND